MEVDSITEWTKKRKETDKNIVGSASVKHDITETQLNDMLVTAFEGGINYWCNKVEPHKAADKSYTGSIADAVSSGGITIIKVFDSEENKAYLVTRKRLIEAFQIMADKYPRHIADFLADNADADTADVWFQCAVFGESIYG